MCLLEIPVKATPKGWVRKSRRSRRNKPKAEPSRPEEKRTFFVRFKPQQGGTTRSAAWTEYRDVSDIPKDTASVPSEIHRELCKRNRKPWASWMLTAIYVNFGGVQQSTRGVVVYIDLDGLSDERRDRAFQKIERDGGDNPVYVSIERSKRGLGIDS
jgi:hypothetical protein